MKWSLLELKKYQETPLMFEETLDVKSQLIKRDGQIIDLSPVKVKGLMSVDKQGYLLHYQVETTMTLPSTRSLTPVAIPFDFSVEEEVLIVEGQTISLDESVADNLLLAIPLQVLTEEEKQGSAMPSGNDWAVLSEEDFANQKEAQAQQVDPRLAKLSELFTESDDDNA